MITELLTEKEILKFWMKVYLKAVRAGSINPAVVADTAIKRLEYVKTK